MTNEVVLDIETQNTFQDVGGRDTSALKISVVGVYTYADDRFAIYTEDELSSLWPILEHADRLIGYAISGFDLPVLQNYYRGDCKKFRVLDMLTVVHDALGYRIKLDAIAQATLGEGKSGHGLDAVRYWHAGELEKLKKYCLDDVRLTRDIYAYGKKHGKILYQKAFQKSAHEIPVQFCTAPQEVRTHNLTLPI